MPNAPDFDSMNETDVRETIVRPLLERLGYRHGAQASIRTEVPLRYDRAFLGRKNPGKDPPLRGRSDYVCDAIPYGRFVVEVKGPAEALTIDVIEQAHTYAAHPEIAAAYFLVTNGRHFALYRTSVLSEPMLAWAYSETEQNLLPLFNVVSPAALQKLAGLVKPDSGKPLGRGIPSRIRIVGGQVHYDEHVGTHPALGQSVEGVSLALTGGFVEREISGQLHAHIQLASAAPMMKQLNELMGLGDYDFFSASEYLSTDVANPTIFQNFEETSFDKGMPLPVPSLGTVPSPFHYDLRAFTEAVGFVDDNQFKGTMRIDYEMSFTGIDAQMRQVLAAIYGSFPQRGHMRGVGRFQIEFVDGR